MTFPSSPLWYQQGTSGNEQTDPYIKIPIPIDVSVHEYTPVLRRNRSNVHMGISDKREVEKAGGRIWSQFGNARHDNAVMVAGDSNLLLKFQRALITANQAEERTIPRSSAGSKRLPSTGASILVGLFVEGSDDPSYLVAVVVILSS